MFCVHAVQSKANATQCELLKYYVYIVSMASMGLWRASHCHRTIIGTHRAQMKSILCVYIHPDKWHNAMCGRIGLDWMALELWMVAGFLIHRLARFFVSPVREKKPYELNCWYARQMERSIRVPIERNYNWVARYRKYGRDFEVIPRFGMFWCYWPQ